MSLFLKYKKWIIFALVPIVLCIFYYFSKGSPSSELISVEAKNTEAFILPETEEPAPEEEMKESIIVIDIKGAIKKPGVYEMQTGARVHQLIEKAGGLKNEADELAINLAAPLEDGMVVYIPQKGEVKENPITSMPSQKEGSHQGKVNINLATSDELQTLTGIGPSKAEAIITYRDENGPFKKPEDLMEVTGIGEKSFEKIKEEITIQ